MITMVSIISRLSIPLFILFFVTTTLFAQDSEEDLKYKKWRFALFPPISTNGTSAPNYSAKYSLNIIAGSNGALDGYEVGTLFNYTKFYTSGFQLAGGANITGGDMSGVNIAGLINYAEDDMTGIQFSGVANVSKDQLTGIQFTAGLNFSENGSSGMQWAGIANISNGDIEGIQGAGLFNYTGSDLSGIQFSSVFNYAGNDVEGMQFTSGINYAGGDISGLIAAGIANIASDDIEGLLLSGVLNIAKNNASGLLISGGLNVSKEIEGLTIAGFGNFAETINGLQIGGINFAKEANGVQIGIINIANEFEGMPVGLISLYGNGRKNIDVRFSDGGFTEIGITTGTHRVYNSLLFGYNTLLDRDVYRVGLAIGLEKNIQDSFENIESSTLFINQEFSFHHHIEGNWSDTKNRILSYKYMIGNRFGNGLSIYGGPSINMQVTRINEANDYTWYSLWSPSRKGKQYRFWVGATIGIRLFKQKNLPLIRDEFNNDWGWSRDW